MDKKFDAKKLLGFRHLQSMSGVESAKLGVDRMYNKIGDEMPMLSPTEELDRIFNKIGDEMPMIR